MLGTSVASRTVAMGFLETIGQRHESRREGSRPAAAQDLISDYSAGPREPAPAYEPRRSKPINRAAVGIVVLLVVAAVGVAAWLGLRKAATLVAPTPVASADAPPSEPAQVAKPDAKRIPARRRQTSRSAVKAETAVDTKASERGADTPGRPSASDEIAPVANVAVTAASTVGPHPDTRSLVAEVPVDNFIYSNQGTGVIAPRLVSLGFPQPFVRGFESRTSALELIVAKDGTVERATISSRSGNWEDALLLSRAKTFQFVPAQRDGYPVRYRLVMRVDATP